jgi:hypothetical protein
MPLPGEKSEAEGEGVRYLPSGTPDWGQRRDGCRIVEPHESVELFGNTGIHIVAEAFRLGAVYDADEALRTLGGERIGQLLVPIEIEQERRLAAVVTEPFGAVGEGGPDLLDFHFGVPVRRAGDGAGMRSEADEGGLIAKPLPAELSDVEFLPQGPHFGVTGITDVGIVRPDDCF